MTTASVKKYFEESSYEQLDLSFVFRSYHDLQDSTAVFKQYDPENNPYGYEDMDKLQRSIRFLRNRAMIGVSSPNEPIDFSYSSHPENNHNYAHNVIVMLNQHIGTLNYNFITYYENDYEYHETIVGSNTSVRVNSVITFCERDFYILNNPNGISTLSHEIGHAIGMPDLYVGGPATTGNIDIIDRLCLMSSVMYPPTSFSSYTKLIYTQWINESDVPFITDIDVDDDEYTLYPLTTFKIFLKEYPR